MEQFQSLFEHYDRLLLFDTETTGLNYVRDEIIEFAAVAVEQVGGAAQVTEEYDRLVALSSGNRLPPEIVRLTGITDRELQEHAIPKKQLGQDLCRLLEGRTLLLAYNAQFDLSFLYYFLLRQGCAEALKGKDKLDLLTVYRDRRAYPHKLASAIDAYGLGAWVENSHRASGDVRATLAVMGAMEQEKNDLMQYINLFGYSPKFGITGKPIASVTYRPQGYTPGKALYEQEEKAYV